MASRERRADHLRDSDHAEDGNGVNNLSAQAGRQSGEHEQEQGERPP
jgi:hypothetical protein